MSDPTKPRIINQRIHRPAASARWEHEHRWGPQLGDSTTLRVARTDDGPISIEYGNDSISIRKDLVPVLADMVAAAAAWTDERAIEGGA